MKRPYTRLYLFFILLFGCTVANAQQFNQYNTGTLYDSFENPSQKTFIADSSRKYAFNLLIPNFSVDLSLAGNTQAALKSRAFIGYYDDAAITLGKKNFNYVNANFNTYWAMFKLHSSLDGNSEWGFFAQSKGEGRGQYPDESVTLLNDNNQFGNTQTGFFNVRYQYQMYHQIGVTYREDLDDKLSFGVKISGLLGVINNRLNIYNSTITYDRPNDLATLNLVGNYRASFQPGAFTQHDLLPTFRNPGASISFGASYLAYDKFKFQFNVKDLGFIRWNNKSNTTIFNGTGTILGLSQPQLEDRVGNTARDLVQYGDQGSFVSHTNALFEGSVAKTFWVESIRAKYTPTFIASKELFYRGFTGALVNHLQYNNLVGTLSASYNDMHYLNLGAQFMVKSPNMEFFIGTERLGQTVQLARDAINPTIGQTYNNYRYSGASVYLGFSLKFGRVIEHPMNASYIPMGPKKSFVKRVWERIINKEY